MLTNWWIILVFLSDTTVLSDKCLSQRHLHFRHSLEVHTSYSFSVFVLCLPRPCSSCLDERRAAFHDISSDFLRFYVLAQRESFQTWFMAPFTSMTTENQAGLLVLPQEKGRKERHGFISYQCGYNVRIPRSIFDKTWNEVSKGRPWLISPDLWIHSGKAAIPTRSRHKSPKRAPPRLIFMHGVAKIIARNAVTILCNLSHGLLNPDLPN